LAYGRPSSSQSLFTPPTPSRLYNGHTPVTKPPQLDRKSYGGAVLSVLTVLAVLTAGTVIAAIGALTVRNLSVAAALAVHAILTPRLAAPTKSGAHHVPAVRKAR